MFLVLLACSPVSLDDTESKALAPLSGNVLVDLSEVSRWEAHPGVGGTQCSLGPDGWSMRVEAGGTSPGYCWLGLQEPVDVSETTDLLTVRATWALSDAPVDARIQVELESRSGDDYIDWPELEHQGTASHLSTLRGPLSVFIRLAVNCQRCDTPEGMQLDQLEVVALARSE